MSRLKVFVLSLLLLGVLATQSWAPPFRLPVYIDRLYNGDQFMTGTMAIAKGSHGFLRFANASGDSLDCVYLELVIGNNAAAANTASSEMWITRNNAYTDVGLHADDADDAMYFRKICPMYGNMATYHFYFPETGINSVKFAAETGVNLDSLIVHYVAYVK